MARTLPELDSLVELLDESSRPIYAVDSQRQIVYCNAGVAAWLELDLEQIIGRVVEYHSETAGEVISKGEPVGPLAELCPPPQAMMGEPCVGTISSVARGGRLKHRHAEFIPLGDMEMPGGVLVLLAPRDMSPQELSAELSEEPSADELHRALRRFRRAQAGQYTMESLLGESPAIRKVRAQLAAAAASGANTLICGRRATGRGHVARAIHYRAAGDATLKLVPVDCETASDDLLRRALQLVGPASDDPRHRPTLLLENLNCLASSHQAQLLEAIQTNVLRARILATTSETSAPNSGDVPADSENVTPGLWYAVSTITIRMPRLVERLEDLPILAQHFLESCNRGRSKQVGSLRPESLDLLALYDWPGELNELRDVIAAAHRACKSHEIVPTDFPPVVHHASQNAARVRRQPERINLDELLANIEREAIVRALAQAGGNKTEAAELLGMTRPRLYRRLVQLGLAGESPTEGQTLPEFIEREPGDETP